MKRWEYMTVSADHANDSWRARYAFDQEIPNWKKQTLLEYMNAVGNDGWELVTVALTENTYGSIESYRLYFKRER